MTLTIDALPPAQTDHLWRQPDPDQDICLDCSPDSPWKAYPANHPFILDLNDLIPPAERTRLKLHLEELRKARIRGYSHLGTQLQ